MWGVGLPEVLVIVVVALVVLGPDRLPEFARQAGRFVRQVRTMTNSAQDELRRELGPEYADLRLRDLDPREAIRRHVLEAMDDQPVEQDRLAPGERPPYDAEAT